VIELLFGCETVWYIRADIHKLIVIRESGRFTGMTRFGAFELIFTN